MEGNISKPKHERRMERLKASDYEIFVCVVKKKCQLCCCRESFFFLERVSEKGETFLLLNFLKTKKEKKLMEKSNKLICSFIARDSQKKNNNLQKNNFITLVERWRINFSSS